MLEIFWGKKTCSIKKNLKHAEKLHNILKYLKKLAPQLFHNKL